jgi:hypothetical protein
MLTCRPDEEMLARIARLEKRADRHKSNLLKLGIRALDSGHLTVVKGSAISNRRAKKIAAKLDKLLYAVRRLTKYCEVEINGLPAIPRTRYYTEVLGALKPVDFDADQAVQTLRLVRDMCAGQDSFDLRALRETALVFLPLWEATLLPTHPDGSPKGPEQIKADEGARPHLEGVVRLAALAGVIPLPEALRWNRRRPRNNSNRGA